MRCNENLFLYGVSHFIVDIDMSILLQQNRFDGPDSESSHSMPTEVHPSEATSSANMFVETSGDTDTQSSSQNSLESTSCTSASSGTCDYQLVLYQPNPVLPVFHEVERSFNFAGKEWTVHQQWNEIGLASVVWEAVSRCCLCVPLALLNCVFIHTFLVL